PALLAPFLAIYFASGIAHYNAALDKPTARFEDTTVVARREPENPDGKYKILLGTTATFPEKKAHEVSKGYFERLPIGTIACYTIQSGFFGFEHWDWRSGSDCQVSD